MHPSTVLRQVRSCEVRQGHVEWHLVFDALIRATHGGLPAPFDVEAALGLLNLTRAELGVDLQRARAAGPKAIIVVADGYDQAPVIDGFPVPPIRQKSALAMVLFGLAVGTGGTEAIARLRLAGPSYPAKASAAPSHTPRQARPVCALHARNFQGKTFQRLPLRCQEEAFHWATRYVYDPDGTAADLPREALGPDMSAALSAFLFDRDGVEAIERAQGWPIRSAKVVLAIALERLAAWRDAQNAVAAEAAE